jgi:cytosine/adenosine deaminase-related metal-dependent hydrolase
MSSNNSLSLWDEMRAGLMLHHQAPLEQLAKRFIKAATIDGAQALSLNKGTIEEGRDADLIMIRLPDEVPDEDALGLALVLFATEAQALYIAGEAIMIAEQK